MLFSALELTHCAHWHVITNEWLYPFIVHIINIHGSGVLVALCGCWMAGATWNAAVSASSVYTIQPCTRLQCHFIQSHIGRVYVCLAVTCHLHFWQNDRDLLCATAVTWGWNRYQNKSSGRIFFSIVNFLCWLQLLTMEKKVDYGEENSPAAPAGTQSQTRDLSIMSLTL